MESQRGKTKNNSRTSYDRLPYWEVGFYVMLCISLLGYSIHALYHYSQKHASILSSRQHLEPGWLSGRLQDNSDFEWRYWKTSFSSEFMLLLAAYFILCRIVEYIIPQYREHAFVTSCLAFLLGVLSWKVVAVMLVYAVMMFMASRSRSMVVVWTVSMLQLLSINLDIFVDFVRNYLDDDELNHFIFYTALSILKYTSFGCECCNPDELPVNPKTGKKQDTFWDFMVYSFYLPLFLVGPILTYDKFRRQMNEPVKPFHKKDLASILRELLHYASWMLCIEIILHFLYFPSFLKIGSLVRYAPYTVLAGASISSLLFFQMKYMPLYGFARLSALPDGIYAPLPPACVLTTHMFKDMWRYFDSGLHIFLVRHIYAPLGGSRKGVFLQLFASCMTFTYVFLWHGSMRHIFFWALWNWLGLVVEIFLSVIGRQGLNQIMDEKLSGWVVRRFMGVIFTINIILIASANLVYLHGTRVSYVQFERLILTISSGEWRPLGGVFLWFYAVVQLAMEAHCIWGKSYLCKKEYYIISEAHVKKE